MPIICHGQWGKTPGETSKNTLLLKLFRSALTVTTAELRDIPRIEGRGTKVAHEESHEKSNFEIHPDISIFS